MTTLIPTARPVIFRKRLAWAFAMTLLSTLICGVALAFAAAHPLTMRVVPVEVGAVDTPSDRGHAPGSPAAVWAKHHASCWRGSDAPKAELPGSAIIQYRSGEAVYTKRPALVSSAFDEALASAGYGDHDDARFEVVALCI